MSKKEHEKYKIKERIRIRNLRKKKQQHYLQNLKEEAAETLTGNRGNTKGIHRKTRRNMWKHQGKRKKTVRKPVKLNIWESP